VVDETYDDEVELALYDPIPLSLDACASTTEPTNPPPTAEPTVAPGELPQGYLCEVSSIEADLDGDGSLDGVDVFSVVDDSADSCETAPDLGQVWGIRAQLSEAEIQAQPLPECQTEVGSCEVVGATDIDGDGKAEVLVRIQRGATTDTLTLYVLADETLERVMVAPPGDEWESEYGLVIHPGPLELRWGGGVRYPQSFGCQDGLLVAAVSEAIDDDTRYHTHRTLFRLEDTQLVVEDSMDAYGPFDDQPPLDVGQDVCGAFTSN
jgi:hypothetical protein